MFCREKLSFAVADVGHRTAGWVANANLFGHLLGTVKSPMKIESNAA